MRGMSTVSHEALEQAARAFFAAHDEDPEREGGAVAPARVYHERLVAWVRRLEPAPSAALLMAAHAQHIRRWQSPRSDFPDGLLGYKKWRSQLAVFHGQQAAEILEAAGIEADVQKAVKDLLLKKGLKSASPTSDVQRLEDAICLTFLELQFVEFAAKHEDAKVIDIVQKTWKKMSAHGHSAALGLLPSLPEHAQVLLTKAVS